MRGRKSTSIITSGAFLLGACSSSPEKISVQPESPSATQHSPRIDVLDCVKVQADSWQPVPAQFNAPKIAAKLGELTGIAISATAIEQGRYGPAECTEGITPEKVGLGQAAAFPDETDERNTDATSMYCLVIGLGDTPVARQKQTKVFAVCPKILSAPVTPA